jgi:hypothetical protein
MNEQHLSFFEIKKKLISNVRKIDFILKNYSELIYSKDYFNQQIIQKNRYYYLHLSVNTEIEFFFDFENIYNCIELLKLTDAIIIDFYKYYRYSNIENLNDLYENIIVMFNEIDFYPIVNLILNSTHKKKYQKIDLSKYDSFFVVNDIIFLCK